MTIAFFDFDGTLTYKDSFDSFLRQSCAPAAFLFKKYVWDFPYLVAYKLKLISTHQLKQRRLKTFLASKSSNELEQITKQFSEIVLPKIIKKSGLERIAWHKAEGHQIWIVSASFDFVLEKWCAQNNINLITNKAEITTHNRLSGFFPKPDCNNEEKVNRIRQNIDLEKATAIYAYGDTSGDSAMLALSHHPHFCFFD
jgi:phosphatidylglycerophosphatase C